MKTMMPICVTPTFWSDPRILQLTAMQRNLLLGLAALVTKSPIITLNSADLLSLLVFPGSYPEYRMRKDLKTLAEHDLIGLDDGLHSYKVDLRPVRGLFAKPLETDPSLFCRSIHLTGNLSGLNMAGKKPNTEPIRLQIEQIQVSDDDAAALLRLVQHPKVELVLREVLASGPTPSTMKPDKGTPTPAYDPWATDNEEPQPPTEEGVLDEEQLAEYLKCVTHSTTLIPAQN